MNNLLGATPLDKLLNLVVFLIGLAGLGVFIYLLKPKKLSLPGGTVVDMSPEQAAAKDEDDKRRADATRLYTRKCKEINDRINEIEYRETLARQMAIAERELDRAIAKMREVHMVVLTEKIGEDDARESDILRRYETATDLCRALMKDRIRVAMRDNGFAERSDIELEVYVKGKLDEFYHFCEKIVDAAYRHQFVKIGELRMAQMAHIHEYSDMIHVMYFEAKRIAIEAHDEIDCLTKQLHRIERHYIETGEVLSDEVLCRDKADE